MIANLAQLSAFPPMQACAACSFPQIVTELSERMAELEARLAKYENAHTPPSLKETRQSPRPDPLAGPVDIKELLVQHLSLKEQLK